MPGDGLGPDTEEQKKQFDDAELSLWTGRFREYYELYQRQLVGDFLTPAEEDRFLELRIQVADYEKLHPAKARQIIDVIRTGTPSSEDGEAGPGEAAGDAGSILNSTFSESTSTSTKMASDYTTRQTAVRYVDLPTPEEFLDDWSNSYGIHITGLTQTGAIRPEVAEFARQMQGILFDEYLRKQVSNLLEGTPLYKVVGLDPQSKLLGSRAGEQSDTVSEGSSKKSSSSTYGRTESSTATTAPSTTGAGQAVDSGGGSSSGTMSEDETLDSTERNKFDQTEAIVQRNKLSYVSSLSPLDFLKDAATAQRLNLLFAGHKGDAQRQAQTATGGDVGGVRRI